MTISHALKLRSSRSFSAYALSRHVSAAVCFAAAIVAAQSVSSIVLEFINPAASLSGTAIARGAGIGFLVALFHVCFQTFQRPMFERELAWSELRSDFMTVLVAVFCLAVSVEILSANSQPIAGNVNWPVLLTAAIIIMVVPLQMWMTWSSEHLSLLERDYTSERSARATDAIVLGRLRTYQSALDEHFSVVVTDVDGCILQANKKFCQLSGYSEHELVGRNNKCLNSGVHSAEFFAELWGAIESGRTWSGQICNRAKDGFHYWVEAIIFPIYGEGGAVQQFVSIQTDISEVRRQSKFLQLIVDNFPGGVALVNENNEIVAHNDIYRQLWDLPDALFENALPNLETIVRYNAERGEYGPGDIGQVAKERYEIVTERKNKSYEWVRPNGNALLVNRTPVDGGGLLTTYIDTTERRAAEDALQRAHAQLAAFVQHAPVSVAMVDNDLIYVGHTARWSHEFSLPDALVGRHHFDVFHDLPERYKSMLKRCLGGAIESNDNDLFVRENGNEHFLRWEVRPWMLPDESIGGLIMMTEDISDRKKVELSLWRAANIDGLTGLANRRQFRDKLAELILDSSETGASFALGILDIDKFKNINDIYGHDTGDILLAEFSRRLASTIGSTNFVARLGGDEFAFIIADVGSEDSVAAVLAQLFEEVAEPFELAGSMRHCSISGGITFYPSDAKLAGNLLKNADLALYSAKSNGRSRYEYFNPVMRQTLDRSIRVRREITEALETDALCLYFQPVVGTSNTVISGVEALLRWRNTKQGILPPGAFLEAFDDPALAAAMGTRVMELALSQAGEWKKAGTRFGYVAINVTSFDFSTGDFVERLAAGLKKYGLKPNQVMVEVTEGMFLGRGAEMVQIGLEKLSKLGVSIALDDFGTGYASLTHIKKFPINCLKIDRSFVHDMAINNHSLSIIKAVLQLAKSLGLQIVAEGIETQCQRQLLEALGCQLIQGYLIAKPLPAVEATEFISRHADQD